MPEMNAASNRVQTNDAYYDSSVAPRAQIQASPYTGGGSIQASPYTGGGSIQMIDPAAPGYVDPNAQSLVDPSLASYQEPPADPLGAADAPYPVATNPVGGVQPATAAAGGGATLQDFAALGIFSDEELSMIASWRLTPTDMNDMYVRAVQYMQSPEYAQQTAAASGGAPVEEATPTAATPTAATPANGSDSTATAGGSSAWNDDWAKRFRGLMKEQGLDSKTQLMVTSSLKTMGLDETALQQAFTYYSTAPEGLAELKAADEQVRAGVASQDRMMLLGSGAALAGVGATTALARSSGNLSRVLERTAASGSTEKVRAAATSALDDLKAGRPITAAAKSELAGLLRQEGAGISRLRHPFGKMSVNAAARNVTAGTRLSGSDALKYGLWMKTGDAATEAASDATKLLATSADDVAKGVSGPAAAAKGVSTLGKFGKALGPVGLVASAALGAWGIKQTVEAEGEFGEESAKMTGNVVGGLAGGVAGAAAGAAIGSVVPVIGTGVGAIVGGIVGGIGVGKIGEGIGGFVHGLFD